LAAKLIVLKGGLIIMNKIFRKISTALGSVALIGATIGAAAAASWPEPFTSNTAIVVGANAAPSDNIAAASIASNLNAAAAGSGGNTVIDGESYKLEKLTTKFHLGDTITSVVSATVDEEHLPILLVEGVYVDDDNDEFDYDQKITLKATQLAMFSDNDYDDSEPTIGFRIASSGDVLDYTLDFSDEPLIADISETDLPMMGKEYYILSQDLTSNGGLILTLLDSASETLLTEGGETTVNVGGISYTVGIDFVSSTEAKLTINGETTNTLGEGETYKLKDGTYVGVKDILYSSKDTGVSKVEFSIGNGKLVLTSGSEVEMNDEVVSGVSVTIVNTSTALSSITIDWNAENDIFITDSNSETMPGFEAVSLSFTGLNYPAEEEIRVEDDGSRSIMLNDFPIKDSTIDLNLLYTDAGSEGTWTGIGKDSTSKLVTTNGTSMTFDMDTDEYFVVSYVSGKEAESYLMRANNFKIDGSTNKTTFQYYSNNAWTDAKTDRSQADTFSMGGAEIGVGPIDKVGRSVVFNANNSNTNFNQLYSKEGIAVYLPFETDNSSTAEGAINLTNGGTGHSNSTFWLVIKEEDKDDNKVAGDFINVTLGWNSQATPEPSVTSIATSNADATSTEIASTDVYRDFTYSALATEILWDKGPDQRTVKLVYHGSEVAADAYLTASDAVSSGSEAGVMTVTDTQASTVAGKHLVVVGGSAINSVAAELLGGAYREAEFTAKTGVSAGGFLIRSFNRAGKTALLVAGYNAADTEKATTYLLNNDVDTTVGNKYMGTSSTEATLTVVA